MARMKKKSFRDRITLGDIINVIVLLAFTFLCFYPFWYIFIGSVSNPNISVRTLTFLPKDVTWFNYREVLRSKGLMEAMTVSVARTVLGTLLSGDVGQRGTDPADDGGAAGYADSYKTAPAVS